MYQLEIARTIDICIKRLVSFSRAFSGFDIWLLTLQFGHEVQQKHENLIQEFHCK